MLGYFPPLLLASMEWLFDKSEQEFFVQSSYSLSHKAQGVSVEVRIPCDFNIRRILLPITLISVLFSHHRILIERDIPVTTFTCATPWLSLSTTPICDGVAPFLASLQICSTTLSGVDLNQVGTEREYGMAEAEIPFPLLWRRPILTGCSSSRWR